MRKDIEIHINTGDIVLSPQNKLVLRTFSWVSNPNGMSRYLYGEVSLPSTISEYNIKEDGVQIEIPYTPVYKEFYIRIRRVNTQDTYSYIQNSIDGSEWFLARTGLYGGDMKNAYASELLLVSENYFYLKINKGFADIYSGNQSDFNIIPANRQNANLLLKCLPTNNYRYPLTGVGLIRWTNSNINHTKLSDVLKKEFESDGVYVKNASFDMESKDLQLELDTSNVDKEDGTAQS